MAEAAADLRLAPTATHWGAYQAEIRGGRLIALRPFPHDPDPSPIGQSIPGAVTDALRIPQPMIRHGWLKHGPRRRENARGQEPFVAVPWNEALDIVAAELGRIKAESGNAAIFAGSYGWASAGRFHFAQGQLRRFLALFGGSAASVNSYSTAAAEVIVNHVFGNFYDLMIKMPTWEQIAADGELVVAFGGLAMKNAQVHHGGFGRHIAREGQSACLARGVKFVNVSALRDDVADFLDAEWISSRPNSDVALMLGLAHTLVAENLHDADFLARRCVGWERFQPYLLGADDDMPKDADWASRLSDVSADVIRDLARRMAKHRTLITISWSLQRADHGEQTYWMAITLAAMLGQIGLPGGGIGFGYGAMNGLGTSGANLSPPGLPAGPNPVAAFIPVARVVEMLENPGGAFSYNGRALHYPDARLIYWVGGNPFHHHQDLGRLTRAWQIPETIIAHEPWWNAHARHADIVLPATTPMERNDIAGAGQDFFALAMHKAIEPYGEARNDHDIFAGLAQRLGFADAFTEGRDEMGWLALLYERWRERASAQNIEMPTFAEFWARGHFRFPERSPGTMLADFRADPTRHKLPTPSGKIEIFSTTIAGFGYDDCPGHPAWHAPAEWLGAAAARDYPLHLISNQPRTRLHSQYDNGIISQHSKIQGREPIWIYPGDAATRGVEDGDIVRVFNARGACLAGAVLTDSIRRGVVQLATGAWYSPVDAASTGRAGSNRKPFCAAGNPNVLTRDAGTSPIAQGSSAHTCLVNVEKYDGPLPPLITEAPPAVLTSREL